MLIHSGVFGCIGSDIPREFTDGESDIISVQTLKNKDPEPIYNFDVLDIPFVRINNLIAIEASVDDQKGYFILDTGAPYLVLNLTYFRHLNVKRTALASAGIGGYAGNTMQARVKHFQIAQITYRELDADVINLSHIEDTRGVKILGLLGFNLFKKFELELNIRDGLLTLNTLDETGERKCAYHTLPKAKILQLPMLTSDNVPVIEARIDGRKLKFCLDTAAEYNVLDSRLGSRTLKNITIKKRVPLVGASGVKGDVLYGVLKNLAIQDTDIPDLNTMIMNLELMSKAFDYDIDGMLGFDFMSRGIVRINCVKKMVIIDIYP